MAIIHTNDYTLGQPQINAHDSGSLTLNVSRYGDDGIALSAGMHFTPAQAAKLIADLQAALDVLRARERDDTADSGYVPPDQRTPIEATEPGMSSRSVSA
jgi:hypothetical protein